MFAEEVGAYYNTSRRTPDTVFAMTKKLIEKRGGWVTRSANIQDGDNELFLIEFIYDKKVYRLSWPVLPTRKSALAARRQAATAQYHDVKAALVRADFMGFERAFKTWLAIDAKRTVSDLTHEEISSALPKLLEPPKG